MKPSAPLFILLPLWEVLLRRAIRFLPFRFQRVRLHEQLRRLLSPYVQLLLIPLPLRCFQALLLLRFPILSQPQIRFQPLRVLQSRALPTLMLRLLLLFLPLPRVPLPALRSLPLSPLLLPVRPHPLPLLQTLSPALRPLPFLQLPLYPLLFPLPLVLLQAPRVLPLHALQLRVQFLLWILRNELPDGCLFQAELRLC